MSRRSTDWGTCSDVIVWNAPHISDVTTHAGRQLRVEQEVWRVARELLAHFTEARVIGEGHSGVIEQKPLVLQIVHIFRTGRSVRAILAVLTAFGSVLRFGLAVSGVAVVMASI